MHPTKFRFIWQSGFRGEDFLEDQKQELSMVAIFVNGSGRNEQSQQRTFHRCFLPSFGSFVQMVSEKNLIFSIGHVSYCHHFSSVVCHPSVNISHFNLLLRNHWANCNQTLMEWSLDGPLPKLCPVIPTSNQDGCQAKNRKKGG